MQSRLQFVVKFGGLAFLTACSSGTGLISTPSSGKHLTASWKLRTANTSDWYIAVDGYSLSDIFSGSLPRTFNVREHSELGPSPIDFSKRNAEFAYKQRPCSTAICASPSLWQNMGGGFDISSGTLPDGSQVVGNQAEFVGGNSSNALLGVDYYGSNGSSWFAGANHLDFPISNGQQSSIVSDWYAVNTNTGC